MPAAHRASSGCSVAVIKAPVAATQHPRPSLAWVIINSDEMLSRSAAVETGFL